MKPYDTLMVGGFYEGITQNTNAFNAASAGALRVLNEKVNNDYGKKSFFKNLDAVSRRDDTSTATANGIKLLMDEDISVKVKRKFGPVETTRDALRSQGIDPDQASYYAGLAMADGTKQEMLNTVVSALDAALSASNNNIDVSGIANANQMSHLNLNKALALMGDNSSNVKLWVMSGAAYHALIGSMLSGTAPQFNDSGISVYNGGAPTLARPVLVTDSSALSPTDKFVILGLTENAAMLKISEDPEAISHVISGNENLITRFQGESAYNIQLKGYKWNIGSGGRNPAAAALNTASNWTKNVTSDKSLPGVRLVVSQ